MYKEDLVGHKKYIVVIFIYTAKLAPLRLKQSLIPWVNLEAGEQVNIVGI